MVYTHEDIQFSESGVKYNLINFLNLLIDMRSLSGAGRLFHNIGPLNLKTKTTNRTWKAKKVDGHDKKISALRTGIFFVMPLQ